MNKKSSYYHLYEKYSMSKVDNYMIYSPTKNRICSSEKLGSHYSRSPSREEIKASRKKLVKEILKMNKSISEKKVAQVKALSLCRIVDPMTTDEKNRLLNMKSQFSKVLNTDVDRYTASKIFGSLGIDSFDPYQFGFLEIGYYKFFDHVYINFINQKSGFFLPS